MPKCAPRYDVFDLKQPPQPRRLKMIMPMLSRKTFATKSLKLFVWDVWLHSQIVCCNVRLPCLLLIRCIWLNLYHTAVRRFFGLHSLAKNYTFDSTDCISFFKMLNSTFNFKLRWSSPFLFRWVLIK